MSAPVLFLVPARAGSRRVPAKNLRTVGGIPLVGWAVRSARLAAARLDGGPHVVACSTDDPAIAAAAMAWGADRVLERPAHLAGDAASSYDVAIHALDALDPDRDRFASFVLVQPTSPLTQPSDLRAAIERLEAGAPSVVSVTPSHPAGWHMGFARGGGDRLVPAAAGGGHLLTGAIYAARTDVLREARRFVADGTVGLSVLPERSIDIDEEHDFPIAEAFLAARPVRPVPVGDRSIGEGAVFVIAEVGVNHDGDPERAHRLIDVVAESGADAVKFQTFDPAALVAAGAPTAEYQRASAGAGEDQLALLGRLALPADAWAGLQGHAVERGLVFLSTPFDDGSADLLAGLGVPAFKIGSGELTNLPFLERLARRGRPLLVSTGMADMVEVAAAIDAIGGAGDPPVALLHCVSSYPAEAADANLRAIDTMRRAFGVPVGWSDHTPGVELPLAAVAVGAALVEKHVTTDRSLPGPDHRASLEPAELTAMVAGIRAIEAALGSGVKVPVSAERPIAAVARRSLHWRRSLEPGSVVAADDLAALRPGTGISPARQPEVVGRTVVRAVVAGSAVDPADLEAVR